MKIKRPKLVGAFAAVALTAAYTAGRMTAPEPIAPINHIRLTPLPELQTVLFEYTHSLGFPENVEIADFAMDGKKVLEIADSGSAEFVEAKKFGKYSQNHDYIDWHIDQILSHGLVNVEAIQNRKFKIIVDAVNSTGGLAVPPLLQKLGAEVTELFFPARSNELAVML